MKLTKFLVLFLSLIAVVWFVAGCSNDDDDDDDDGHTHKWNEATIIKPATCESAGEREMICDCGETKIEIIPKLTNCDDNNITPDISWYNASQTEFTITTAEQLAGLAKLVNDGNSFENKTITLGANIMLNDTTNWRDWHYNRPENEWVPIGYADYVIGSGSSVRNAFFGTFDGNGYNVSGMYVGNEIFAGFFGVVGSAEGKGGTIKNLRIKASYVASDFPYGGIGGLAGNAFNSSIENISYIGIVRGGLAGGGLIGVAMGGKIENSFADSDVLGFINGSDVSGGIKGGLIGMVGHNDFRNQIKSSTIITNSYAIGNVIGMRYSGGLIGAIYDTTTITNTYATGNVRLISSNNSSAGGLVGYRIGQTTITNSYYNSETSGQSDTRGTPKTTAEMKQQATFVDWDFVNVWNIDPAFNDGYPYLRALRPFMP